MDSVAQALEMEPEATAAVEHLHILQQSTTHGWVLLVCRGLYENALSSK